MAEKYLDIRPHAGPQRTALQSPADVLIFGGARGGGKSWSLLLEAIRYRDLPGFGAVIFRRTYPRITATGGLWEASKQLYGTLRGIPREGDLSWRFPPVGTTVRFRHLERESNVDDWQGAQIPMIGFDELTEFTEHQFWALSAANRAVCGCRPFIRATCNPDAESWVAHLVSWWIDQDTGYPIPERAGKLRWFIRDGDELIFANRKYDISKGIQQPRSLTFIPSRVEDNPTLMEKDPEYRARLLAMPTVERERFYHGNWIIRPQTGLIFPRDRWEFRDAAPHELRLCRYWDKAGTKGGKGARSAGVLIGVDGNGVWYVVDAVTGRWNDIEREDAMAATAEIDQSRYGHVIIFTEQEPGSGGKDSAMATIRRLAGFDVHSERPTGKKPVRWRPFAAQQQAGNVVIVRGNWDWQDYVMELDQLSGDEQQDKSRLRDLADASAGAFNVLARWAGYEITGELLCADAGEVYEDDDHEGAAGTLRELIEMDYSNDDWED